MSYYTSFDVIKKRNTENQLVIDIRINNAFIAYAYIARTPWLNSLSGGAVEVLGGGGGGGGQCLILSYDWGVHYLPGIVCGIWFVAIHRSLDRIGIPRNVFYFIRLAVWSIMKNVRAMWCVEMHHSLKIITAKLKQRPDYTDVPPKIILYEHHHMSCVNADTSSNIQNRIIW